MFILYVYESYDFLLEKLFSLITHRRNDVTTMVIWVIADLTPSQKQLTTPKDSTRGVLECSGEPEDLPCTTETKTGCIRGFRGAATH